MKRFLKKIFFWDNPAAGAVFGWVLATVFAILRYNVVCLDEWFLRGLRWDVCSSRSACLVLLPALEFLMLLAGGYSLLVSWAFFYRQDRTRFKWGFWSIAVTQLLAYGVCSEMNCERLGIYICGFLTCVGFNALCIRRHSWGWYVALLFWRLVCLPGAAILLDLKNALTYFDNWSWDGPACPVPMPWRVPLAYCAVLGFLCFAFCNFKLWAAAVNRPLREVWGAGCNVLLLLLAVFYLAMVPAAFYQQKQCAKALAALEQNFGREVSAGALKELYYRDRRVDENFHPALQRAWEKFAGGDADFKEILNLSDSLAQLPPRRRDRFCSPDAEAVARFFDAPLPAPRRDYASGKLAFMVMPELGVMRQAARLFAWQIRIACENRDHAGAMRAWKRSARVSEFLERDRSLIAAMVLLGVEQIRLNSLERMLSSGLLSDRELSEIRHELQLSAERLPAVNRNALYCEAVFGNDFARGFADGALDGHSAMSGAEGVKHYRFLLPGLWYLACCNYCNLLTRYNVENLDKIDETMDSSLKNFLTAMLLPALNLAGQKMHEMEMRYQAFAVLLEAEKSKRKTGKYPDTLPLDIVDFFSGRPLRYKVGSHEIRETFLTPREKEEGEADLSSCIPEERKKTVYGVAVWSVGGNKLDDHGRSGTMREDGERTDDPRALITVFR